MPGGVNLKRKALSTLKKVDRTFQDGLWVQDYWTEDKEIGGQTRQCFCLVGAINLHTVGAAEDVPLPGPNWWGEGVSLNTAKAYLRTLEALIAALPKRYQKEYEKDLRSVLRYTPTNTGAVVKAKIDVAVQALTGWNDVKSRKITQVIDLVEQGIKNLEEEK